MSIVTSKELARTFENTVDGQPRAVRRWAVVLSDDTLDGNPITETELATHLGITTWGTVHPSLSVAKLNKLTINERFGDSPYHVEVVAEYGNVTTNQTLAPIYRTHEWSFESSKQEVPALFYFDGSTKKPLTNSAYDYFEGLTVEETLVKATVKMNLTAFPTSQMMAISCLNSDTWFGSDPYSWKVAGVNTTYIDEAYNGVQYQYWATTCELLFRQTGWVMQLPDVGWNYLDGGQKRRAMVFDYQNGEWVASPNPVGLNGSGQQTLGVPAILPRRVNDEAAFASLFGTPPE